MTNLTNEEKSGFVAGFVTGLQCGLLMAGGIEPIDATAAAAALMTRHDGRPREVSELLGLLDGTPEAFALVDSAKNVAARVAELKTALEKATNKEVPK
jgi:hypothetical protein